MVPMRAEDPHANTKLALACYDILSGPYVTKKMIGNMKEQNNA